MIYEKNCSVVFKWQQQQQLGAYSAWHQKRPAADWTKGLQFCHGEGPSDIRIYGTNAGRAVRLHERQRSEGDDRYTVPEPQDHQDIL